MEEELARWGEERRTKQNTSARQTGELINKITNLRETLGLLNEEEYISNKHNNQLASPSSYGTDYKASLTKVLESSQTKGVLEGQIPIFEHETIVRDELLRMEQHYKSLMMQSQLKYEEKLTSLMRSIEERDIDLHKCLEDVIKYMISRRTMN